MKKCKALSNNDRNLFVYLLTALVLAGGFLVPRISPAANFYAEQRTLIYKFAERDFVRKHRSGDRLKVFVTEGGVQKALSVVRIVIDNVAYWVAEDPSKTREGIDGHTTKEFLAFKSSQIVLALTGRGSQLNIFKVEMQIVGNEIKFASVQRNFSSPVLNRYVTRTGTFGSDCVDVLNGFYRPALSIGDDE